MGYEMGEKADNLPWSVEDALVRYVELLGKNVIGTRVEVLGVTGKLAMN